MYTLDLSAWTTDIRVVMTDETVADQVHAHTVAFLDRIDRTASRFRPDSELSEINQRAKLGSVDTTISPLMAMCLGAALDTARLTGGLVTPTIGSAMIAAGYDRDIAQVMAAPTRMGRPRVPHHRGISLDGTRLVVDAAISLDLGASSKAWAADQLAADLASIFGGGFLVCLGGDVAVGGEAPEGGWLIDVVDSAGRVVQTVTSSRQAFATSSTQLRAWVGGHHIIDPRTGRPADLVWSQVTCAGASTLQANAASTAAIILGKAAPAWLTKNGIPARLDSVDGQVVRTPGWPDPRESQSLDNQPRDHQTRDHQPVPAETAAGHAVRASSRQGAAA